MSKQTVPTIADLMKEIEALKTQVTESKVRKSRTKHVDDTKYTIMPSLSEALIMAGKIAPQAKCCMVGLVRLRKEKIDAKAATSGTFTFTRREWEDASVRLGGLRTDQGADRVNKWYLDSHSKYQLLEDERKEGSLNMIQRA